VTPRDDLPEDKEGEMDARPKTFSRDEVVQAERRAWAENGRRYYFDGTYFWYESDHLLACDEASAPMDGWRHREECRCDLCRTIDRALTPSADS
jgi:hypothetical protein